MTVKWYETKKDKQERALRQARANRGKGIVKHSRSYQTLVKRSELLNKPSVVGISASGINTGCKDVKQYLKENHLTARAGVIKRD
jgi:hypothetical protein